jgi:hypothetical protein
MYWYFRNSALNYIYIQECIEFFDYFSKIGNKLNSIKFSKQKFKSKIHA